MHHLKRLLLPSCRIRDPSKYSCMCQRHQNTANFTNEFRDSIKENTNERKENLRESSQAEVEVSSNKKKIKKRRDEGIGFWKSEQGLQIYEQTMTGVGRVLRMFVSKERYDNFYETALMAEYKW